MVRDHVDIIGLEAHTFHIMCTTTTVLAGAHMLWFVILFNQVHGSRWMAWEWKCWCITTIKRLCTTRRCSFQLLGSLRYLLRKVVSILSMLAKTRRAFWSWFSHTAQRRLSCQRILKSHKMAVWCQYKRCTLRDLQGRFSKWLVLVLNEELHGLAIAWT